MRYIVSGIHRSGTSMMMKCLIDGGINPVYSEKRESRMRSGDKEDYELNPDGFWEVGQANYMQFGYTSTLPDECCVKIQSIGLPILSSGEYKIVFMRRNPETIKISYIRAFGEIDFDKQYGDNWLEYYEELTSGVIGIMRQRRDVDLIEVNYNDVVNNPELEMNKLKDFGIPIDVNKAKLVPNTEYRRNEAA